MKKIKQLILFLLTVAWLIPNLSASDSRVNLKLMGGISSSTNNNIWADTVEKPMGGLGVEFWFSHILAVEINGYYVNKGLRSRFTGYYRKLPELAISGLLRLRIPIIIGSLGIFAGYEVGIPLVELDSIFSSYDTGVLVGGGFDFPMKGIGLFAEIRYRFPGSRMAFDYVRDRSSFQPRTTLFIIGIKFKIGK
jgi:hypothetical protein